jgi:hypothetical protein
MKRPLQWHRDHLSNRLVRYERQLARLQELQAQLRQDFGAIELYRLQIEAAERSGLQAFDARTYLGRETRRLWIGIRRRTR